MDSPILMVLEACMQGLITMRLFLLPFAYDMGNYHLFSYVFGNFFIRKVNGKLGVMRVVTSH